MGNRQGANRQAREQSHLNVSDFRRPLRPRHRRGASPPFDPRRKDCVHNRRISYVGYVHNVCLHLRRHSWIFLDVRVRPQDDSWRSFSLLINSEECSETFVRRLLDAV
ncbi:hypothetical protein EVAR_49654_1 [Eumeta japonica]|uniref:Uncharacterized protein n=1 Tax=Eumeta variegata TaxID=151549 RepID=A0A4C1YBR2_EUMVA|nr:hypothetical protein EVAR_49654_1 [Eumeta japonica]